jgi:hypothetical protein
MSGQGLANLKFRFKGPSGDIDTRVTKGAPDIVGKYDISTGATGGSWVVWILADDGSLASPQVSITTQAFVGGPICPNRIDFRQQR